MTTNTQTPDRCERCEQPYGTCHHTAPPIAVGDVIHPGMTFGAWHHALRMRSNSRAIDPAGNEWVKTRRRDGAWENLTDGAIWPLGHIIDERQGYGPLTVEHVAGRRK